MGYCLLSVYIPTPTWCYFWRKWWLVYNLDLVLKLGGTLGSIAQFNSNPCPEWPLLWLLQFHAQVGCPEGGGGQSGLQGVFSFHMWRNQCQDRWDNQDENHIVTWLQSQDYNPCLQCHLHTILWSGAFTMVLLYTHYLIWYSQQSCVIGLFCR